MSDIEAHYSACSAPCLVLRTWGMGAHDHDTATTEPVRFETHPDRYRHWKLELPAEYGGAVARIVMDVKEDGGLRPGYPLKLNSYDLGVDIELADALNRVRFEHPE